LATLDAFASAVKQRNVRSIIDLMFERDHAAIRRGFRSENELWDFKGDCPTLGREANSENAWASIAADVLAFHNVQGGVIIFGISDAYEFVGVRTLLDSKKFNDRITRYLPDTIWVDYHREFIQVDQKYLGLALVPPRGPLPIDFKSTAPVINGRSLFVKGDSAKREGDSTKIMHKDDFEKWTRELRNPVVTEKYIIDEPLFRILQPDYASFVDRPVVGKQIESALRDPRTSVASLVGLGGMGKTALATWATLRAYDAGQFEFIVSVTAKDRELTSTGILGIDQSLSTFEDLLDSISEVLGFPDLKGKALTERERDVRYLLENSNGLLFVDNLETVDDARIIEFLDTLPVGTRAITTSRRTRVRVAVSPIDVGPMNSDEVAKFVHALLHEEPFKHFGTLQPSEIERIGKACEMVPLAIRWILSSCSSTAEAISTAESARTLGRHGDELLEFCFRRVFDSLAQSERSVMEILATLQSPLPIEAIIAGSGQSQSEIMDAVDDLSEDAIIQRYFDRERNDFCFTLMPLARSFVMRDLNRTPEVSTQFQKRLRNWFDAMDVSDEDQRLVVRTLRSGRQADDSAIVDLALSAQKRGDFDSAERLYEQALTRNPKSWRASRFAAEFQRHERNNRSEAIRLYRVAVANAPTRGSDRAIILREYGLVMRDSGEPNAAEIAEEALQQALVEIPNDQISLTSLASLYNKRGAYHKVINLLESKQMTPGSKFCDAAGPLLLKAYDKTNESVKYIKLRRLLNLESEHD